MTNSLQDNVLSHFDQPDPLNPSWVQAALAGILRHGILSARELGISWSDVETSTNRNLNTLRKAVEEAECAKIVSSDRILDETPSLLWNQVEDTRQLVVRIGVEERTYLLTCLQALDGIDSSNAQKAREQLDSPESIAWRRDKAITPIVVKICDLEASAVSNRMSQSLDRTPDTQAGHAARVANGPGAQVAPIPPQSFGRP